MKKILLIIISTILLTACAAPSRIQLVTPYGSDLPNPAYTFFDTQQKGYSVTFFYSAIKSVTDLDGTVQHYPEFLSLHEKNELDLENYSAVLLTVGISNENLLPYRIMEDSKIKFHGKISGTNYLKVAESNMKYRTLQIELPFRKGIKEVNYTLEFYDNEDELLFRIGEFNYFIKEGGDAEEVIYNNN